MKTEMIMKKTEEMKGVVWKIFQIKTDGDLDCKDVKRAVLDYMRNEEIESVYCHVKTQSMDDVLDGDFPGSEYLNDKQTYLQELETKRNEKEKYNRERINK